MIDDYEKPTTLVWKGWQCPICGRVYSPTAMMCLYCGNEKDSVSPTYTIDWLHREERTKAEGE